MSGHHVDRQPLTAPFLEDSEDEAGNDKAAPGADLTRPRRRRRTCRIADDAPVLGPTAGALARALVLFGIGAAGVHLGLTSVYEMASLAVWPPAGGGGGVDDAFRLYKNSRFAACAARSPVVNCTLLEADLNHPWRLGAGAIGVPRDRYFMSGARYQVPQGAATAAAEEEAADAAGDELDEVTEREEAVKVSWCDLVSCMAGWKVVPSTPRAAALGPTALTSWWSLLITALGTLGALRGLIARPPAAPAATGCAPAGLLDRLLLAWEAGQLGFWWWAVPAAALGGDAAAGRPALTTLTGWLVPWVLAVKCRGHPWSCYLAAPTRRRLAAALHALAAVQWAATVYVALLLQRRGHRHGDADAPSSYDCLAADIAAAPGASPCSAERLCASPWLLRNPDFAGMDETAALSLYTVVAYLDLAAFPLYLGVRAALALARRCPRLWTQVRRARLSPFRSEDGRLEGRRLLLGLFLARGYLHLLYALPFFVSAMDSIVEREGGFATVAYDLRCRAVHVGVSPKHFYLDITAFDRGLRVVRQWFNT